MRNVILSALVAAAFATITLVPAAQAFQPEKPTLDDVFGWHSAGPCDVFLGYMWPGPSTIVSCTDANGANVLYLEEGTKSVGRYCVAQILDGPRVRCDVPPQVAVGELVSSEEAELPKGCVDPVEANDFGVEACYSVDGYCKLETTTTDKQGERTRCVVGRGPRSLPEVGVAEPGAYCYAIGNTYRVGPVTVQQHSSCSYTVSAGFAGYPPEALRKLGVTWDCPAYYSEREVGPATVIMAGCGGGVRVYVGPDMANGLLESLVSDLPPIIKTNRGGNPLDMGVEGNCVDADPSWASDWGYTYCLHPEGPCYVTVTSETIMGSETRCAVGNDEGADRSATGYARIFANHGVGPAEVTMYDTCTYEVEVTTGQSGCLDRYQKLDLGAVVYESINSCHYSVLVNTRAIEFSS